MDFVLYGKDARLSFLAEKLEESAHRVRFWKEAPEGFSRLISLLELALPVRLLLPLKASADVAKEALSTLPVGSRVFGGGLGETAEFAALCARRAITWTNLEKDDAYCRENAIPTAEGALHALLPLTPKILSQTHVALLGSGRVAEAVLDLFLRLGMHVTLLARNGEKRKAAEQRGCSSLPLPLTEEAYEVLGTADALINTVEVQGIVNETLLSLLPRGVPVLELASGKENIDAAAAEQTAHELYFLPALPGKIAPSSAADALFSAITKEG